MCAILLTILAFLLVIVTMPFSLCVTVKVVQEYERAVVFRLGRLRSGGAKGPGLFFIMPCVDSYKKVDLRTVSFDVPPQEVRTTFNPNIFPHLFVAAQIWSEGGASRKLTFEIGQPICPLRS